MSILAPLYQCCRLRNSTFQRLKLIASDSSQKLSDRLSSAMYIDPLSPILTPEHLYAIDRRLDKVFDTINKCVRGYGEHVVFNDDGFL